MATTYERRQAEDLFDVDDGPMLRKRQMVMAVCVAQIIISGSLGLLQLARRKGAILLILNPFFIAAGVLGYIGAKNCHPTPWRSQSNPSDSLGRLTRRTLARRPLREKR